MDDTAAWLDDTTVRLDDTAAWLDDPTVWLDGPAVRLDDPTVRLDDPTVRLDDLAVWVDGLAVWLATLLRDESQNLDLQDGRAEREARPVVNLPRLSVVTASILDVVGNTSLARRLPIALDDSITVTLSAR